MEDTIKEELEDINAQLSTVSELLRDMVDSLRILSGRKETEGNIDI